MGATFNAPKPRLGKEIKTYETLDAGVYAGRCIRVVDVGTQNKTFKGEHKQVREIIITWEVSELMEDGRPFIVSWRGTNSLNTKAKMFKLLSDWRGKPFTEAEAATFSPENILDKPCLLNVIQEEWTDKEGNPRISNKVTGAMPLPKGMKCDDRFNDLLSFGINDIPVLFEKLYPSEKGWVRRSIEGEKYFEENPEGQTPKEQKSEPVEHTEDDEQGLPF
jgi:hypothetical protein